MAVLTRVQQGAAAEELARFQGAQITYSKDQLGTALQAIENIFEGARVAINTAINTATAPLVLSASVKRQLLIFYLRQKADRE